MSTNVLWETKLGRLELILFEDGQLFIESISGDVCKMLLKPQVEGLYLALKDYFENEENK